jgi:hypothetical protein
MWENLPIEVILPVSTQRDVVLDVTLTEHLFFIRYCRTFTVQIFNYTPHTERKTPTIFPSAAVVQGNIESGRRNYKKLFEGLEESMTRDASIWGYHPLTPGKPVEPLQDPGASPFVLHLLGQMPKNSDLKIPVELENVIRVHPGLEYPDFYKAIVESVSRAWLSFGFRNSLALTIARLALYRTWYCPLLHKTGPTSRQHLPRSPLVSLHVSRLSGQRN